MASVVMKPPPQNGSTEELRKTEGGKIFLGEKRKLKQEPILLSNEVLSSSTTFTLSVNASAAPKRPRLGPVVTGPIVRPPPRTPQEVLNDAFCANDRPSAMQFIREFAADQLSVVTTGEVAEVAALLLQIVLRSRFDNLSKTALAHLVSLLEQKADADTWQRIVDDLLAEPKDHSIFSRRALEASLLALFAGAIERGVELHDPATDATVQRLSSVVLDMVSRASRAYDDVARRRAAIRFAITNARTYPSTDPFWTLLEKNLCEMSADRDPRVRVDAVQALEMMAERPDGLTVKSYKTVKELCRNSDRQVRESALRLAQVFADRFPEHVIPAEEVGGVPLRLCDDAFATVCNAVNDLETPIRVLAVTLLGKFTTVSDSFLEQTLDKKLMASMKTSSGGTAVQRIKESMFAMTKGPRKGWRLSGRRQQRGGRGGAASGSEWSSGKILHEAAPDKKAKEEEESIISTGACGAFITALEDEFMAVRKAAVYSLGTLACTRPSFANAALDNMADMFNDEIEEVRLDSIFALTPLIVHGQLVKEQLDTILKCLDDAHPSAREALRELLCNADIADLECLKTMIRALINCLARFPSDMNHIFDCMSRLGKRHAHFVHAIVAGLLDIHPTFDPVEQPIEDVFYIAKLIMVLNAASESELILALLPPYTLKHYRYLRGVMPQRVPLIERVEGASRIKERLRFAEAKAQWEKQSGSKAIMNVLEALYTRLETASNELRQTDKDSIRRFIIKDLEATGAHNESLASPTRFLIRLAEIATAVEEVLNETLRGQLSLEEALTHSLKEQVQLTSVETQFANVDPRVLAFVAECRFVHELASALCRLALDPRELEQVMQNVRAAINQFQQRLETLYVAPSEWALTVMAALLEKLEVEGAGDEKKFLSAGALIDILNRANPRIPKQVPKNIDNIRVKWAEILEPHRDISMEKEQRFVVGLPTSVHLIAHLHNFLQDDIARLRIQVHYPDGSRDLCRPRKSEITPTEDKKTGTENAPLELSTNVIMSARSAWSDSALLTLKVVLLAADGSPVPLPHAPLSPQTAQVEVCIRPMLRC